MKQLNNVGLAMVLASVCVPSARGDRTITQVGQRYVVEDHNGWNCEQNAINGFGNACASGPNACMNRSSSGTGCSGGCSAQAPAGYEPNDYLALGVDPPVLIAREVISRVAFDAVMPFDDGAEGQWDLHLSGLTKGDGSPLDFRVVFTTSGRCGWTLAANYGSAFDITHVLGRPWTAADVGALQIRLRRNASTRPAGKDLWCSAIRVDVHTTCAPIAVVEQPVAISACLNSPAIHTLRARTNLDPNVEIVWVKDGDPSFRHVGPSLTFAPPHSAADNGTYGADFASTCGALGWSNRVRVDFNTPPIVIIEQPVEIIECVSSFNIRTLQTRTNLDPNVQVVWVRASDPNFRHFGPTLTFSPPHSVNDNDIYGADLLSPCGAQAWTDRVQVKFEVPVTVVQHPGGIDTCALPSHRESLRAEFANSPTTSILWWKIGVPGPIGSGPELFFDPILPSHAGTYYASNSNSCGRIETNRAVVTVGANLVVTGPTDRSGCPDQGNIVFAVQATGAAPLSYAWFRNGVLIATNDCHFSGQRTNRLKIEEFTGGQAGEYFCEVTSRCGSRRSASANFTISAGCCDSIDFNNDCVSPDSRDVEDFLSVFAGGSCSTNNCNDIDFNNDSVSPDSIDIEKFLNVFAGGTCP